jgi:hypothetical protein
METQLEIASKLFADDTKVIYAASDTTSQISDPGHIILQPYKLSTCPDVETLLKALAKRTNRVEIMKLQKYSSALCIALLASKGYCITSMELNSVPDTTIEVCWETLHNIYISVDEPLKSWIFNTMAGRGYVDYGAQFCQRKFLSSNIEIVGSRMSKGINFKSVDPSDSNMPQTIWDSNGCILSALSSHFRHEFRDISNDT